ncbi:MAG: hypothetical protein A2583_09205 [Bdellovibrionales bacterium RIFOXYD1_FULL_53_11]|nr:MAG: hypothetical protein A2583_09205 [Bdellovibrionales bacterium RIFOXYD1_FULL_53_11]
MKFTNGFKKTLFLATVLVGMSSCSHGPAIQDYPDTANPIDEVKKLDSDITMASQNQIDVLSPYNFSFAQESLKDAKTSLDKQQNSKETLHSVATSRAYLVRANEFAKLSTVNLEEVVIARKQAIASGANNFFPADLQKTDNSLKEVTSDIEKNELKSAKANRSTLQLKYLDLELQSIKTTMLGQARTTIAQAIKEGAKDFAPRSLAIAEKKLKDTDAFITANRHDSGQIFISSNNSRLSADHLLKITRDSKAGKKTSSEETALKMENEQNKAADKQIQLNVKTNQLENKQNQLDIKQGQLIKSKNTLDSERAFNERYEIARAAFIENEAEVYKKGNTLTIRLRGLEFPVAQAVLKGSNFPLLAKVQKVMKSFGNSSVIVEGHTDSMGGKAMNNRLSIARATAVKEYFISNADDNLINIEAVGYGYQKPLASNKTSKGRAQNRRVDVLIQPVN